MVTLKVTADGQVTIPQEILNFLDLKPGDQVELQIREDDKIVIQSVTHQDQVVEEEELPPKLKILQEKLKRGEKIQIEDLKGFLHREGIEPASLEKIDEVVKQHVANHVLNP